MSFRRPAFPLVRRIRWAASDFLFGLLCIAAVLYGANACMTQSPTLVRLAFAGGMAVFVPYGVVQLARRLRARRRATRTAAEFTAAVPLCFAVRPCFRCYDAAITLKQVAPLARSVHYACATCGRRAWAAATSPDAHDLWPLWCAFERSLATYRMLAHAPDYSVPLIAATEPPALPYEATRREHIPADLRRHVWQRDGGRCAQCGSTEQLELDHVIPVARGGATTLANLSLLCRACNRRKAASL